MFADSLPDGWGRLLVDCLLLRERMDPATVNNLNRLAIVGATGMGALTYQLETRLDTGMEDMSLDQIAEECGKIFEKITM
ncbi:MAG: HipA N-terminal domain-containing protein [Lachnospiraceae bacterium]|nr:HipA N-terminal domain-containing protein [Lachnospiraceae bacterium]MCM1238238.1 HipA N-terminal domain-containing protein [Lachnospiraceae bacterium]